MLLPIAVIYFLGIQSVASSSCPRLRCISRQLTSRDRLARHLLLRCKLSQDPLPVRKKDEAGPRAAQLRPPLARSGWRPVASGPALARLDDPAGLETSTVALVDGLCVTEYYLSELRRPNATASTTATNALDDSDDEDEDVLDAAAGGSPLRVTLRQVTGLGNARPAFPMVCNTTGAATAATGLSGSAASWQQCAHRVPRLEIVEALSAKRSVVCAVCSSISHPGESDIVYHSISRALLLRLVLRSAPSSSSSSGAATHDFPSSAAASSYASLVSSLSVTLNVFSRGAPKPTTASKSQPSSKGRSLATCRWKCGWFTDCLRSRALVCDGRPDCPLELDEMWCEERGREQRGSAKGGFSRPPRRSDKLSAWVVYALVIVGCLVGLVFLLLCFFWAFCSLSGTESFRRSLLARHRRRHRRHACGDPALRGPGDPEKDADCPLCAGCCSLAGAGPAVLLEQPSTACSSSGVFEESNASSQSAPAACPNCSGCRRAKLLGAEPPDFSGSSPALPCAEENAGAAWRNGAPKPASRTPFSPGWPPNLPSARPRPAAHHRRSSRGSSSSRRARPFVEAAPLSSLAPCGAALFSGPAHHQDWLLNLPVSVRRCNDDDPRQAPAASPTAAPPVTPAGSGSESGRLLPPPNLNPFLDVPHQIGLA